jgi:hypothetical protein
VCLEASTKPHVHKTFEIFWTNIASTMAYLDSKNGPKNRLRPLGVKATCSKSGTISDLHLAVENWFLVHS